jgi:hypothetical protein
MKNILSMANIITGLIGAIGGAAIVALPNYWGNNRQMDVKMVEIAVSILSQEPKDNIAPARKWAVDVIGHYSDVKLSKEVVDALIENRALQAGWHTSSVDSYTTEWTLTPRAVK